MKRRFLCLIVALSLLLATVPSLSSKAEASNWNMEYFLKKYSDSHFNLNNEPNRAMTVEEFLAIEYAYSYYGDGAASVTCRDKNGKLPSAWCGKFVQAEVNKGAVTPAAVSWTSPVTLAFAARYLCRAKGKYSYESNNIYYFTGTSGLSADDILYLSVAVDCGLLPYTYGMNVAAGIARKDAHRWEVPTGTVTCKAAVAGSTATMRECHAYFTDCYWDLDAAATQLAHLKEVTNDVSMVTFQFGYITQGGGVRFDLDHSIPVKNSPDYSSDPTQEALSYCKQTGKLCFIGITNAVSGYFDATVVSDAIGTAAGTDALVSAIVAGVQQYGFSGVNMGVELGNSAVSLRPNYANFLKKLSAALHQKGLLLLTTVGAYFTDAQEQAGFYDYAAIAAASDYVHEILYDDFTDTGYPWRKTCGPMSNLTRIGRCIRYASVKIGTAKLLLGMSAYATDFNTVKITAQDISYTAAEALRKANNASLQWDSAEAGSHFGYTDAAGAKHLVYLEAPDGIASRVALVQRYGLCGASVYYLGSGYNKMFSLISAASSYKSEVMGAVSAGLVPASLRGRYNYAITRKEFCKMATAFIAAKFGTSADNYAAFVDKPVSANAFTDCTDTDVAAAAALGIVTGYGGGLFKPNNLITRQEAAAMLTRLAKVAGLSAPNASAVSFAELPSMASWAQEGVKFISACSDPVSGKRVMGGVGANKFSPTANYTREQSAMTMIRLLHAAK